MKSPARNRRSVASVRAKLFSVIGADGQPLFVPFDIAEHLRSEEDLAGFLTESFSDGRPDEILHAIFTACRARGMSRMARDSGLGRESLYKALASRSHPRFETILKVVRALGLVMELKPASKDVRRRAAAAMSVPRRRKTVKAVAKVRRKSA